MILSMVNPNKSAKQLVELVEDWLVLKPKLWTTKFLLTEEQEIVVFVLQRNFKEQINIIQPVIKKREGGNIATLGETVFVEELVYLV